MFIGEKIKSLRTEQSITQEELAIAAGTKKQTIHKYETGIISNIPASKIKAIADKLGTTPAYLMGWEDASTSFEGRPDIFPVSYKKFRVLGEIACGEPIYADEDRETVILANSNIDADFCLYAKGDSMTGARIMDGDIVFIKQCSMVQNGEIAAVIIEDEATLKRVYYYPDKNKIVLSSENPKYEPFVYIGEELDSIRILGKAVAFQSAVR